MASTRDLKRNNLPVPLTSFIGREQAISGVARVLAGTRLLTLTGSGGSGKSRLALEVARRVLEEFRDGAWLVELASLTDARLVPAAVAGVLGVPERPGRGLIETLSGALREKSLLIILDNCEHLLLACASLCGILLRACPDLRILATSREPLGVPGETVWRVSPLSLPDRADLPSHDRIARFEAVRLFIERAAAVRAGFQITADNARAIALICRRLDGIPLAIELAAARMRAASPAQIAARLDDRFRLLTGRGPTTLPRQRTLRAAMDWSHDLLTDREQLLFARLSVFAGGWMLDAAEAVCGTDGIEAPEMLDLLTSLVDKSLVQMELEGREARYGLLETVREYGRERLHDLGAEEGIRQRHRDWYLALAEHARARLDGPEQKTWLDRLEREHDNLRAALEWSRSGSDRLDGGLRLTVALRRFWENRGYYTEGRAWLESMLEGAGPVRSVLRARALTSAGILAYRQGDYERTDALCTEASRIAEEHSDAAVGGEALHFLAHVMEARGDAARAIDMMQRSVALHEKAGHRVGAANALDCLGVLVRGNGEYERAATMAQTAMTVYREIGDGRAASHNLHNLAYVRLYQGRPAEARDLLRQSLTLARDLKYPREAIFALAGLAAAAGEETPPEQVAQLLGAVQGLLGAVGVRLEPPEQKEFDRTSASVRAHLGEGKFAAAYDRGRRLTLEDIVADALEPERDPVRPVPAGDTAVLTAREREVAGLVAKGLTSREIAGHLVVSQRTVEGHVQAILNKLGFDSRTQIAVWAVEHGLRDSDA